MTSEPDPPPDRITEVRPEDVRPGPVPQAAPAVPVPRRPRAFPGAGPTRAAWLVAIAADLLQWIAFPLFALGAASPWNDVLDVFVAVVMVRLLGWHWAFLPAFVAELVPGVDLVPTWTLAVLLATRGRAGRRA